MQRALVIGDTGGVGAAVKAAFAVELGAANVTGLSRRDDGFDICNEERISDLLGGLVGPFDVVFIATGILAQEDGLPERSLRDLSADALREVFEINALGPALLLKHLSRLLPKDRRSVVAVLSARVGSIEDNRLGGWYSYRASKAALNQIIRSAAIEWQRSHKHAILVSLHPGTVKTRFTERYHNRYQTVTPDEAARNLIKVIQGLERSDTGQFFDWAGERVPW